MAESAGPMPDRSLARLGGLFVAVALLPAVLLGAWTWWGVPDSLMTANRNLAVRDYLNLWAAGTLVRQGDTGLLFDMAGYLGWLRARFSPDLSLHSWSYPPPVLFLAVPLSLLPLVAGFAAFAAATMAGLAAALRAGGVGMVAIAAVLASPAALENALGGQNGALSAASLAGGLLLAGRRPVLAGFCLGLLVLKPQMGLLVPVCLLAARDWRTIAWTAIWAGAIAVAAGVVFGWDSWLRFATVTGPFMSETILHAPVAGRHYQFMMPTPFMLARGWGAGLAAAYAVQAGFTLGCAALVWRGWARGNQARRDRARRNWPVALRVALALAVVPLASPYAMSYDMVVTSVAVALLFADALRRGLLPLEAPVLALAWLWPSLTVPVSAMIGIGLGPLLLSALAWVAWRRLQQACAQGGAPPPSPAT